MSHLSTPCKILATAISISLLSGCIVSNKLSSQWSDEEEGSRIFLEDNIHAIGRPIKPVKDYPYALVLAGEKYDYLVQSDEYKAPSTVQSIFNGFDTRYLFIGNEDYNPFDNLKKDQSITLKIGMARTASLQSYAMYQAKKYGVGASDAQLHFIKPAKDVNADEKEMLTTFKFNCTTQHAQKITYTHCQRKTPIELIPIKKTIDISQLEHRFNKPYRIQASYIHEKNSTLKNAGVALLMPLAIAIDIVTFPIQLPMVL